ncbi:hypothetical protein FHS76_002003 [Ochrobactrum daejeonense]|uniref:Uncharacterized protein n=1 Tax=Brucella daejeonensis TaxID=659015 RepID=A0A7W9AWZ0_9HYPH|nr:hypothetical protein [Brucella daejeonensis]
MTHRSILPQEQTVNSERRSPVRASSPAVISPENSSPENAACRLKSDTRQANWRRANPSKYAAHIAVQRALTSGTLNKQPCEICGASEDDGVRIDAHHDDYRKPLKVRWLCRTHHSRLHKCGEDLFAKKDATQ